MNDLESIKRRFERMLSWYECRTDNGDSKHKLTAKGAWSDWKRNAFDDIQWLIDEVERLRQQNSPPHPE